MLTDRPITSREYKLMLNPGLFRDRAKATEDFWDMIQSLIPEELPPKICKVPNKLKYRQTWYLDTCDRQLRKQGFVLRGRNEFNKRKKFKQFKVTLKFRDEDYCFSAGQDLACEEECTMDPRFKEDDKFEEDILPPFRSKFSRSVAFEIEKPEDPPSLAAMGDLTAVFPVLEGLQIDANTPVEKVKGFKSFEVAHQIGQIHYRSAPDCQEGKREDAVKCCLSFWYWTGWDEGLPLVAEFSFDYDELPKGEADHSDPLERFSPEVVAGSNHLFRSLQKQEKWLDRSGTTKTAYVFDIL